MYLTKLRDVFVLCPSLALGRKSVFKNQILKFLYLLTQIRFPIGGERITCHGSKLTREIKIGGRQWRLNENKSCMMECSVLTACLPSSSLIRRGELTFWVLWTTRTSNNKIWQSLFAFEAELREPCAKSKGKMYRWSKTEKLNWK